MGAYIIRRLLAVVPILFFMSVTIFLVLRIVPGDPARAMVGLEADPQAYEQARDLLGLDKPLYQQYLDWLGDALRGDLGRSYRSNESVTNLITDRVPLTFQLTLMAAALAIAIAFPLGVLAGANRNSLLDRLASVFAASGIAIPGFWLALILLTVFSVKLHWFQSFGFVPFSEDPVESVRSLVLPAVSLALPASAILTRMVRSSVVDAMNNDYVRTARAKGLKESTVVVRHVVRNSLIPVLTVLGIVVGQLLSGSIIIEVVFALPGLGRLAVDSILFRELVVVQGVVLLVATVTVFINLAVDLGYGLIDPRVKLR
ncbi:MAG: ABC transporter permease [Dehalococcoidia bacterium]|nr:ABC transporter permease [Dehalococcoidia bacterium]